jgi:predicted phosphodiesterase
MNKIALLSDIHGNILALEAVATDLSRRGVDTVVTLGDLVSGPCWPKETAEYLIRQNWIQIAGNHERQILTTPDDKKGPSDRYADQMLNADQHDWLRSLPKSLKLSDEIMLVHGAPSDDLTYLLERIENGHIHLANPDVITARLNGVKPAVLACGHSHTQRVVRLPDGMLIINPGSVGMPAYTDDGPHPHVVETGSPHALYAILEKTPTGWTPQLISVEYDHEKAARQADSNNRPELAMGLRTGYVTL